MQAPLFDPTPVIDAKTRVYVNGRMRDIESMSWGADTTGGLPEQIVSAGTGIKSRTGSITWGRNRTVPTPIHPVLQQEDWPPFEGDTVVVEAVIGDHVWRRFTGRIGKTTGSVVDGTLTSEITDLLGDRLLQKATILPQYEPKTAMKSSTVAYQAMEYAGYGVLPYPWAGTIIHAPMQGDWKPIRGQIWNIGDMYRGDVWTSSKHKYTPIEETTAEGDQILVIGRQAGRADAEIAFTIAWTNITVKLEAASKRLTVTTTAYGGNTWTGEYIGDESEPILAVELRRDGGRVWTSPTTSVPLPWLKVRSTIDIFKSVTGTRIAGTTVYKTPGADTSSRIVSQLGEPVAHWHLAANERASMRASRGYDNEPAGKIVDDWCRATLSSVWADEFGRPQAWARDQLKKQAPARTVKVTEKMFEGAWERGYDQIVSEVVVKGQQPTITYSGRQHTVMFRPDFPRELVYDETQEEIINIPDDEDWLNVDYDWQPVLDTARGVNNVADANNTLGSLWQICYEDGGSGTGVFKETGKERMVARLEKLGTRAFKTTFKVTGQQGYPGVKYWLATPTNLASLNPNERARGMPVLRGDFLIKWTDYTVRGKTRGPSWAPPLDVDCSWWWEPEDAQRIADELALEATQPAVTFTGVDLLWDPSRQIGDVEEWIYRPVKGDPWTAMVLVTGYSESWDGTVPSQRVDVRVIRIEAR